MSRRRWWLFAVVAVVVVVLAVVGVFAVPFLLRDEPGPKTVEEAVEEFRGEPDATAGDADGLRPAAGVYTARGEGRESLSLPPISQSDGSEMPVTVTHEPDGCWVLRIDYNAAHWQTWRFCWNATDDVLVETGGNTYQRWDLGALTVENLSTFTCDPPAVAFAPDAVPGDEWQQSCTGTNSQVEGPTTSAGPYRLVAREVRTIGDRSVEVDHYRQSRTISGSQEGSQTSELWIARDNGMPVRIDRVVRIASASPVGSITYEEDGWWELVDLTPAR